MFLQRFQCDFGSNKIKYARMTITHICSIVLTLVGSLRRCLNTRLVGLVLKQLPHVNA